MVTVCIVSHNTDDQARSTLRWLLPALLLCGACSRHGSERSVVCHYAYGGDAARAVFAPTRDPYTAKAVSIANRFELKAVYLTSPEELATVNISVYDVDNDGRLLHTVKYAPPYGRVSPVPGYGFTGRQRVYSAQGRELEYFCELVSP